MADERISSFITDEAIAELLKADSTLESITQKIIDLNNAGKKAEGLSAQAKSLEDISKSSAELASVQEKLLTSTNQLAGANKTRVQTAAQIEAAARKEAKAIDDLENDYKQLSLAYNEAALKAKNYALRLGENHAVTVQAIKDANDMAIVLKRLDASVGQNQRSVGDYTIATRGLQGSIQQIARELPSLSGGFAIFASAIGNNIAPAADAMARFREEQKLLQAQGKQTQSLFSALGGAIFNWQTLLLVGVTLLTVYGKEIGEFTKSLFAGKEATDAAAVSMRAYNKALEDPAIKTATAEFEQMEQNIRLAKDGLLDKKNTLNIYNDTIGKTLGHAKDLNEAEATMVKNKQDYLDMLKAKTVATSLYAQESAKLAEAALIEAKIRSGDVDFLDKAKGFLQTFLSKPGVINIGGVGAAQGRADQLKQEANILDSAADEWEKKMAEIAKKIGADPFGGKGDKKEPKKKIKDLTDELSKLRDIVIEFGLAIRNPTKSELDAITKDLQNQIDVLGGKVEFEVVARINEEKAATAADSLREILERRRKEKGAFDPEKDAEKKKKGDKADAEALFRDSMQLAGELDNLQRALSERKIQQLDNEINKINEKRDAEILAIQASFLSEEEKQRKIAELNIAARQEEKKLEREKIEAQRRAAIFERGVTIAQIIANTAKAVVAVLPNYVLAALNAAIGAAQLATVIAAPLPQYEEGTKGKPHPGGKAVLFEGNKPEAVFENGRVWIGDKEGVYDLSPGAQVMSNKELMNLANMYTLGMPALIPRSGGGMLDSAAIRQGLKDVQRAIENKPAASFINTWQGMTEVITANRNTLTRVHNLRH